MSVGRIRKKRTSPTTPPKTSMPSPIRGGAEAREIGPALVRSVATFEPSVQRERLAKDDHQENRGAEKDERQRAGERPIEQLGRLLADQRRHHERARASDQSRRDVETERENERHQRAGEYARQAQRQDD